MTLCTLHSYNSIIVKEIHFFKPWFWNTSTSNLSVWIFINSLICPKTMSDPLSHWIIPIRQGDDRSVDPLSHRIIWKNVRIHVGTLKRLVPTNICDITAPLSFIHGLLRWVFKPSLIKTKAKEGGWQLRSYLGLKFRGFRVQISKIPEYLTTGWVSNYFQRLCIAKDNQFFAPFFVCTFIRHIEKLA